VSGWTKLYSSIVTSSIWVENDATLRVWIAMLAAVDADGIVEGSIPGFANLARVTTDQMRAAVVTLSSPDPDSRTPDYEGRRIETIEGGWRILNYRAYRERCQAKEGSKAPAMRAYRARQRAENSNALPAAVTGDPEERGERKEKEEEKEKEVLPPNPPSGGQSGGDSFSKPENIITSDEHAERAGGFLRRFADLHHECRHGAFLHLKPARDFPNALKLVDGWPDADYLAKMAELFFRREEWSDKSTPGQFLSVASQCDALLRKHGCAPRHSRRAS
jgi:hypothetical protein